MIYRNSESNIRNCLKPKWAYTKKQWYWHSESFRKKGKKTLSMDDIRSYYGSTEVRPEERLRLKQA